MKLFHPDQTQLIYYQTLPPAQRLLTVLQLVSGGCKTGVINDHVALAKYLQQRQHTVILMGQDVPKRTPLPFHTVHWHRRIPVLSTWQLWQVAAMYQPDILLLNGFHHLLTARMVQRLTHSGKIVVDFREDFLRLGNWQRFLHGYHHVDGILVHSHFAKWWVTEKLGLPTSRVYLIPYALDTRLFFPNTILKENWREAVGLHPDDVVIGTVLYDKSLRTLREILMAVRQVSLQNRRIVLALLVEKPLLTRTFRGILREVQKLIGKNLRIQIIPLNPHHWEQLHVLDMIFQPQPGWRAAVPFVRAMASGIVPIGYNHGEIPELFVHNASGILVQPYNWQALARAIHRLVMDPSKRKRLRQGARHRAVTEHPFPKILEQLEQHFYRILQQ